ncbi:MAG: hypothetical protein KDD59_14605, partial [Bdellovibrionales bacterium]|nr:hypothetical protein [Bdellovibrionales bacterium]
MAHLEDLSGDSAIKVLRIFLNSERLYFDLAKKNLEHDVEILKSAHGRYCVLSSPPWVKWQSYLMFLEQNYDAELLDEDDLDYTDQVAQFVRVMVSDLSLAVDCSDLEVYSPTSESPWDKINRVISPSEGRIIRQLIVNDRSFYLPDVNMIFLSRYSINHC